MRRRLLEAEKDLPVLENDDAMVAYYDRYGAIPPAFTPTYGDKSRVLTMHNSTGYDMSFGANYLSSNSTSGAKMVLFQKDLTQWDFGIGDFTLCIFFNQVELSAVGNELPYIFGQASYHILNTVPRWFFALYTNQQYQFFYQAGDSSSSIRVPCGTQAIGYRMLAITRKDGVFYYYNNGVFERISNLPDNINLSASNSNGTSVMTLSLFQQLHTHCAFGTKRAYSQNELDACYARFLNEFS